MSKGCATPKQRRHREVVLFGRPVVLTPKRSRPAWKRKRRKMQHESRRRNRA